ncbi:MAG: RNA polymerase sigma factor [Planctomycetota bacterium]
MSASDDRTLVDRCISAEPGAWRLFVDRFAPLVRALARRYLTLHGHFPDDSDLDDVVQDVFLAVTRKDFRLLRDYDPTYAFTTYLAVITRTEVHRGLRRRRPALGAPEELEGASPPAEAASAAAERSEEHDALTAALGALPPRDAEILKLRFLREMDYKAIAAVLRIPESSVGQTLFRAKQKLLERLKGLLGLLV